MFVGDGREGRCLRGKGREGCLRGKGREGY